MTTSLPFEISYAKQKTPFRLDFLLKACSLFNNPNKSLPFPIHVVGTNGKGSTIAFLEAILEDAGYKVNVYTSPHLVCYNERIKLNGRQVEDEILLSTLETVRATLKLHNILEEVSFFEIITLACFLLFSKNNADFCIIEAGLGGRLDATNIIDSKINILTSVSFDHMEFLGSTIKEIAFEKLAIAKGETPFIISKQPFEEVYTYAKNLQNSVVYGEDFVIDVNENGFLYSSANLNLNLPKPSLFGVHQYYNAANTIKACELIEFQYGYRIEERHIVNGIQNATWHARLERINKGKILKEFSNLEVILDGGHNEDGVKTVLQEFKNENDIFIICGFLKRKNLQAIIPQFKAFSNIYTTSIHSIEDGKSALDLYNEFLQYDLEPSGYGEQFYDVLKEINSKVKTKTKVLILGSLYLAGEVLAWNL